MTRTEFVAVRWWFVPAILASLSLLGYVALTAQSSAPPPSTAAAGAPGQDVYARHCVECHGETGHGDGSAAHLLVPRPRDFAAGRYKIRTTETGSVPTDDDLVRTVAKGLYGTAMPAWETLLSEAQIRAVVGYVKSFSPRFKTDPPHLITVSVRIDSSPASTERGAAVYAKLQCGKCHGSDGTGTDAVAKDFVDDWNQPLHAANLSEPWTFRGGAAAQDIFMRFRAGMSGTPMPSFAGSASDVEMWDLANYVVSVARKPVWEMNAREIADLYARQDRDAAANPVARGRYLVETMGCALCHSPLDEHQRLIPGFYLAGGMRIHLEPYGDFPTGNLTSDKATGLGNWSDDEIKRVVTKGILKDGSRLLPYPMDWPSYASMSAPDLGAIVAYLRTVPPIVNKVPAPSRTILPAHLWGKFKMLILGGDPPMTFYAGNAGQRGTP